MLPIFGTALAIDSRRNYSGIWSGIATRYCRKKFEDEKISLRDGETYNSNSREKYLATVATIALPYQVK